MSVLFQCAAHWLLYGVALHPGCGLIRISPERDRMALITIPGYESRILIRVGKLAQIHTLVERSSVMSRCHVAILV